MTAKRKKCFAIKARPNNSRSQVWKKKYWISSSRSRSKMSWRLAWKRACERQRSMSTFLSTRWKMFAQSTSFWRFRVTSRCRQSTTWSKPNTAWKQTRNTNVRVASSRREDERSSTPQLMSLALINRLFTILTTRIWTVIPCDFQFALLNFLS